MIAFVLQAYVLIHCDHLCIQTTTDYTVTAEPVPIPDEDGKIWICPACNRQDDGSPMIGCDKCDEWFHWYVNN